jgi:glycerophosphoryl diester phosphodiesterase
MLAVAHRAGNDLAALRRALDAGADLVEADVRYFRGALEVRHLKTLGPLLLWDHPWQLVRRRHATFPVLADVLAELGGESRLMLDLKGIHPRLAGSVAGLLRTVAPGASIAICARNWRMLDAFADDPAVRLIPSAGSQRGLRRLLTTFRSAPSSWPGRRQAFGVSVRRTLLTRDAVAELHQSVEKVLTWPVDTRSALGHAVSLGVSGVIGRNIDVLRDLPPQLDAAEGTPGSSG